MLEVEEGTYELIDGLQRISSYLHFRGELILDGEVQPPFALLDCDIVPELNGLTYARLPRAIEIKLKRNFIRAEILRKESDQRLRYYMFKRLNTGGTRLEDQEIRNCTIRLLSDTFNAFLIELSRDEAFKYCIDTVAEAQIHKKYDQELVLRFFAFKNASEKYKHAVGDFLTEYMEAVSDPDSRFDFQRERTVFLRTFEILKAAADTAAELCDKVFGTVDNKGRVKGQFSVYHYETLTLGLQQSLELLEPSDSEQMRRLGEKLLALKKSKELRAVTGGGKNDPVPFTERVRLGEVAAKSGLTDQS